MEFAPLILASTAKHLQLLFESEDDLNQSESILQLEQAVAQAVLHLLQQDLNRLLNILYRVDVDERQVKQAMKAATQEEVALQVARLIIKRELQKAQTRFIYRYN
ncbi:hypothetical protein [Pontibacter burrus]|uniref:Uncharacterized protein n=1 Tax=Pontibacter burrus TaxID=2704466 RepID=A0A6B3LN41_9BACT|nr:hypothetical protein [Pontibacter burrus]NEM98332.1 hypothetical protein [Pontibacter burrus]